MTVGRNVKALRKARGWTQTALAWRLTTAGYPIEQTRISRLGGLAASPARRGRRAGRFYRARREKLTPNALPLPFSPSATAFSSRVEGSTL